jgi:hypothetical protein
MIEGNPIRIRNAIATVTLLVLLSGCAGEMVTVRRIDPSLGLESSPWIDHTRVELETAWGAPQGVQPDGEGGSILEYKRDRAFQVDTGDDPTTPEDDSVLLQEDVNRKTVARFWIDASLPAGLGRAASIPHCHTDVAAQMQYPSGWFAAASSGRSDRQRGRPPSGPAALLSSPSLQRP